MIGITSARSERASALRAPLSPTRTARSSAVAFLAAAAVLLLLPSAGFAATSGTTACVSPSVARPASLQTRVKVSILRLSVQGLSCGRGVTVARRVAADLAAGRSIAVTGASSISIVSTSACTTCAPSTQVSVGYPSGVVNVSLRGGSSSVGSVDVPNPAGLWPPDFPNFPIPNLPGSPFPQSPGSSGVTTV